MHLLRDGDAALEMADILSDLGYHYGELLINHPRNGNYSDKNYEQLFSPDDLLLMTTRPPLDDHQDNSRRKIDRSGSSIEEKVFSTLRHYFRYCSRSQVTLTDSLLARFPASVDNRFRQTMKFKNYSLASYAGPGDNTAFFLVHIRQCWPGGPGLLCAFGMGGPETLIWAHLLRSRPDLRALVTSREFVLAEAEDRKIRRAHSLQFTDDWSLHIAVELPHASVAQAR